MKENNKIITTFLERLEDKEEEIQLLINPNRENSDIRVLPISSAISQLEYMDEEVDLEKPIILKKDSIMFCTEVKE